MRMLCLDIPLPGANLEKYQPHLHGETLYAWKLYRSGFVRDIYFRQDRPGVVVLAEFDSLEEAKQSLADFPLAKAGLIDWQIIPIGPFVNWESLFAPSNA